MRTFPLPSSNSGYLNPGRLGAGSGSAAQAAAVVSQADAAVSPASGLDPVLDTALAPGLGGARGGCRQRESACGVEATSSSDCESAWSPL